MNNSASVGRSTIKGPWLLLATLPLMALAVVAGQLTMSINEMMKESLGEVDTEATQALSATEAIVVVQGANAELIATLAQVSQTHQSALLSGDRGAVVDVRAARAGLTAASNALARSLTGLGEVRDVLASDAGTVRAESRRTLGFAQRGAVIVPRIVALFGEANDRTLGHLETNQLDAARANFLFEERARLEAVTDRVRRQMDVLESLARQVSAIEAEQVGDIIAEAAERTTRQLWIGALAAALIIALTCGLAFRTVRKSRNADLSLQVGH